MKTYFMSDLQRTSQLALKYQIARIELFLNSDKVDLVQEAPLSQRGRATFVSLNILLGHSRSLEITSLNTACVSHYL